MASKQWAVVPHDGYMSDETPPIQIIDGDGNTVACNTTFYPTQITAENAATIVAAVNQRAEFLKAFRILRNFVKCVPEESQLPGAIADTAELIENAIAKLEANP